MRRSVHVFAGTAAVDFKALTVPALKALLKDRGLKVSGNKGELIDRLSSAAVAPSSPAEVVAPPKVSGVRNPPKPLPSAPSTTKKSILSDLDLLPGVNDDIPEYVEPASHSMDRQPRGAMSDGSGGRPGDWRCPGCGATVFASKSQCFRCGATQDGGLGAQGSSFERRPRAARAARAPTDFGPKGHDYERLAEDGSDLANVPGGEAAVDELLAARLQAKLDRDFGTADAIRDQLQAMGVFMHDAIKAWRGDGVERFLQPKDRSGGYGYTSSALIYTRSGGGGGGGDDDIDEGVVEDLIAERGRCKMTGDFQQADEIRDKLKAMRIEVNDRSRVWTVLSRSGHPYKALAGKLTSAIGEEARKEVDALIAERHGAKRARDFQTADALQEQLRDLGVEVDDFGFTWRYKADEPSE